MNLSNKNHGWHVPAMVVAWMAGGLSGADLPARAQESFRPNAVSLAEVADVARMERAVKAVLGKVVLVNFWASWNGPSVTQYPAFTFLYDRYHAQGLEVISVATDPVAERDAHVIPFIQYYKTKFPTYLKADIEPTAFLNAVDTAWTGDLPRTYVLGRDGKVRQVLNTRINPDRFEALLKRLLKEEAPKPKPALKNGKSDAPPPRHLKGFLGGN